MKIRSGDPSLGTTYDTRKLKYINLDKEKNEAKVDRSYYRY